METRCMAACVGKIRLQGLVKINEVAAKGQTPVSLNFQQAYNAPGSPWLSLTRDQVIGSAGDLSKQNAAITAILGQ